MSILVFIKCYPDLYSPSLNTVWFTWIVRIEHCLNAFLSISLIIWFLFYSIWKKKSMWNLSFIEGLKIYKKYNSTSNNHNSNHSSNIMNFNNNIEYNLSSHSSHRNGPKLMNRIEKTSNLLFYSMIVCILVYLLQSISQLIFTEIYISIYGNGVLVLYDSYIIVIGCINSLSDFTPFLMCYIFHKSNQIIRDIVKDDHLDILTILSVDSINDQESDSQMDDNSSITSFGNRHSRSNSLENRPFRSNSNTITPNRHDQR